MRARLGLWRFGDEVLEVAADHDDTVIGKRDVAGLGIIVGRRWWRRRRRKVVKFSENSDRRWCVFGRRWGRRRQRRIFCGCRRRGRGGRVRGIRGGGWGKFIVCGDGGQLVVESSAFVGAVKRQRAGIDDDLESTCGGGSDASCALGETATGARRLFAWRLDWDDCALGLNEPAADGTPHRVEIHCRKSFRPPSCPSYTQSSHRSHPIYVTAISTASQISDLLPNWLAFPTFDPPLFPSRSPGSNLTEGPAVAPLPLVSCSRGDWTTGIFRTGQSSHGTTWFVHIPSAGRSSPHVPTSMAAAHLVETRQAHLDFDKWSLDAQAGELSKVAPALVFKKNSSTIMHPYSHVNPRGTVPLY